ncbi:methyl-accepting chemotaxis protein [Tepidibacillus infernus]
MRKKLFSLPNLKLKERFNKLMSSKPLNKNGSKKNSETKSKKTNFISVKAKILVSFLTVVILMAFVSLFALYQMIQIQKSYEDIVQNDMNTMIEAQELESNIIRELSYIQKLGLTKDERLIDQIEKLKTENHKKLNELVTKLRTEADQREFKKLQIIYTNYNEIEKLMIEAAQQDDIREFVSLMDKKMAETLADKMMNNVEIIKQGIFEQQQIDNDKVNHIRQLVLITTLITILLAVAIAIVFARMISTPVKLLDKHASLMADGDLTQQIPNIKNNDEIGHLVRTFEYLQEQLKQMVAKIQVHAEQVASTSVELAASTEQTTQSTEQISLTMQEMAANSDTQVVNVQETAEFIDQFQQGIVHITENANDASTGAAKTSTLANNGMNMLRETIKQMNGIGKTVDQSVNVVTRLNERSQKINEIVDLITNIADQTNLLALNAAIEAARAGEHGRGFAVVADEVRKLAEQSGNAAKNIAGMIIEIKEDTTKVVQSMTKGNDEVKEGILAVEKVNIAFEEILTSIQHVALTSDSTLNAAKAMEQYVTKVISAIEEMKKGIEGNASFTQTVAAASEEQNASMEEVRSSIESLSYMAEELRELINQFKIA